MSRIAGTILGQEAYGIGRGTPMVDIQQGGQFGFQPEFTQMASNTLYVRRNLVARLISGPAAFKYLPNGDKLNATLKALVEMWPQTIEGLKSTLTTEYEDTPFGPAGEMIQAWKSTRRARSEPQFTYGAELLGRPMTTFFNYWVEWLLGSADTQTPLISTLADKPLQLLQSDVSMVVLFFEPNATFTSIDKAWLSGNMAPMGELPPIEGKKDPTAEGEKIQIQLNWTATTMVGQGVNQLAQKFLSQMSLTGANPNMRQAFMQDISADVKAADSGIAEEIANAARTVVQPT